MTSPRSVTLDRVLCPTDFSEFSATALDYAASFAASYGSHLRVLHVVTPFPITAPYLDVPGTAGLYETASTQAREALAAEATRAARPGLSVDVEAREGLAVHEILASATDWPADLLVMGTHGRGGFERLVLGSVAEKVLRKAPCPVLAVPLAAPGDVEFQPRLAHVLCAHDGSAASRTGVAYAQALAERAGARLTLLSVVEALPYGGDFVAPEFSAFRAARDQHARDALDAALSPVDRVRLDVHDRIVYGHPGQQIVEVAAQERPDLVVMGVQGRGALDVLMFGSTTHYVLRHARTPVLTVRPGRGAGGTEAAATGATR